MDEVNDCNLDHPRYRRRPLNRRHALERKSTVNLASQKLLEEEFKDEEISLEEAQKLLMLTDLILWGIVFLLLILFGISWLIVTAVTSIF